MALVTPATITGALGCDGTGLHAVAPPHERRHTMPQESRTQEIPTPAPEPGELTDAALALVAGGGDGGPGNPGDGNGLYGV